MAYFVCTVAIGFWLNIPDSVLLLRSDAGAGNWDKGLFSYDVCLIFVTLYLDECYKHWESDDIAYLLYC